MKHKKKTKKAGAVGAPVRTKTRATVRATTRAAIRAASRTASGVAAEATSKTAPCRRGTRDPVEPPRRTRAPARRDDAGVPPPGSVLTRRYKGRDLLVTVTAEGFRLDGESFRPLTAVARRVTGYAAISGPHFFRLKAQRREQVAGSAPSRSGPRQAPPLPPATPGDEAETSTAAP